MAMGETPEAMTLRKNISQIVEEVAADPGPVRFATKLKENDFLSNTDNAVVLGTTDFAKVSSMIGAVEVKVKFRYSQPEKEFAKFINILRTWPCLNELVDHLLKEYRNNGGVCEALNRVPVLDKAMVKLDDSDHFEVTEYLLELDKSQIHGLGMTLGLSHVKLKKMMDSSTFLDDVIAAWLREEDQVEKMCQPTWRNLVNALRHKRLGQAGIADVIEKNKCQ